MMYPLQIFLFGKFEVRCGERMLTDLDAPKVQELFCYLLLNRSRPHPREMLAERLWSDQDTGRPNRCLRKTLWQLRTALDCQTEPLSDYLLVVEPDWVQLNPEAELWLDVAVFEQAFSQVKNIPGDELDAEDVMLLQRAVDLYRGGLQESWYQDWYLYERERFQHMYLVILDKLMSFCEARGDCEAGLSYGELILRCEKARECTHRRLMRLFYLADDRTAALRQYQYCTHALEEELGVRPAKRTVALYHQICTDQFSAPPPIAGELLDIAQPVPSPLPRVLVRLRRLQTALADIQHQVQHDIQAVELAMTGQQESAPRQ